MRCLTAHMCPLILFQMKMGTDVNGGGVNKGKMASWDGRPDPFPWRPSPPLVRCPIPPAIGLPAFAVGCTAGRNLGRRKMAAGRLWTGLGGTSLPGTNVSRTIGEKGAGIVQGYLTFLSRHSSHQRLTSSSLPVIIRFIICMLPMAIGILGNFLL